MAKKAHTSVYDALLDKVATATRMVVTSSEPADFTGIAAVALADVAMAGADFTKAAGDVSGRKVTVAQKSDVPIDASGTATHVCLDDGVTLLYVTTCTSQALSVGGTVTIPAWDIEVAAPS